MAGIAIFDFDGTLTRGDTLWPWMKQMQSRCSLTYHLPYYVYLYLCYRLSGRDADRYKERIIGSIVKGWSYKQGMEYSYKFAHQIDKMIRPGALRQLRFHQNAGHQTILLTASTDLAVSHWAHRMGFDLVLATEMEIQDGYYTGHFATPNCKGLEKVHRLDHAIPHWRIETTYGYGDSVSDRFFLTLCTESYYGSFD